MSSYYWQKEKLKYKGKSYLGKPLPTQEGCTIIPIESRGRVSSVLHSLNWDKGYQ
jgi:hypothetical protein